MRITEPFLSIGSSQCVIRYHSHHSPAGKLDYSHSSFADEATLRLREVHSLAQRVNDRVRIGTQV